MEELPLCHNVALGQVYETEDDPRPRHINQWRASLLLHNLSLALFSVAQAHEAVLQVCRARGTPLSLLKLPETPSSPAIPRNDRPTLFQPLFPSCYVCRLDPTNRVL
ncbi:hypothetical protein LZ30DRAFT_274153 [Colletotrichum cereale]|nr:hypothetical protein LZ30DRAFT_274153 [Colletotrichum cereale]